MLGFLLIRSTTVGEPLNPFTQQENAVFVNAPHKATTWFMGGSWEGVLVKDPAFQLDWKNKLKRPVCITSAMDTVMHCRPTSNFFIYLFILSLWDKVLKSLSSSGWPVIYDSLAPGLRMIELYAFNSSSRLCIF